MRPSVKRSLTGVLIAGALVFSAVGVEAMGGGNGPDAFIGIINGGLSLTTTALSPTTTTLSPTTTALSPTTTALEEAPSKPTPAIDSATFAGMAKEAMADVATKAAITAGTEKADHSARSWVYGARCWYN